MLFDLLNHRDFALSLPIGIASKDAVPPIGRHLHDCETPLGVGTERRRSKGLFFLHKKEALAFFGQRALGKPHSFLVLPLCGESDHHYLILRGLLLEKVSLKSHAKGLRGGFFCRFEVYRTAILRK